MKQCKGYLSAMLRLQDVESLMLKHDIYLYISFKDIDNLYKERKSLISFLWTQKCIEV